MGRIPVVRARNGTWSASRSKNLVHKNLRYQIASLQVHLTLRRRPAIFMNRHLIAGRSSSSSMEAPTVLPNTFIFHHILIGPGDWNTITRRGLRRLRCRSLGILKVAIGRTTHRHLSSLTPLLCLFSRIPLSISFKVRFHLANRLEHWTSTAEAKLSTIH